MSRRRSRDAPNGRITSDKRRARPNRLLHTISCGRTHHLKGVGSMSDYRDRDRETVVVERDGSGGLATILGILVIIALLAAVWYFTLGPGAGAGTTEQGGENPAVPTLEVPAGGGEEEQPASS
jgi:hypothetical protein